MFFHIQFVQRVIVQPGDQAGQQDPEPLPADFVFAIRDRLRFRQRVQAGHGVLQQGIQFLFPGFRLPPQSPRPRGGLGKSAQQVFHVLGAG